MSGHGDSLPKEVQDRFQQAMQQHRQGQLTAATAAYEEILRKYPEHAGAWHLLGVAAQQEGRLEQAAEHIEKALALSPNKAVYRNNYGATLQAMGRWSEAWEAYRQAVALQPNYPDALSNLGLALLHHGHLRQAREALERALQLQPAHLDAMSHLARVEHALGNASQAIELLQQVLRAAPRRAEDHNNLANVLLAEQRAAEAVESYQKAIALRPGYAEAYLNLGHAHVEQEQVEQAADYYRQGAALRPGLTLWKLRQACLCPAVFPDTAAIEQYHTELEAVVDEYLAEPPQLKWQDLLIQGCPPPFNISYHGRNNRRLKTKFAQIFTDSFPLSERWPARRGKPRVGLLVNQRHEGIFLRCMTGILERMDNSQFDLVVLCSQSVMPKVRGSIRRDGIEWVSFPDHLPQAVERIREAECDVLYHWEVGSDSLNYFLPFAPLAPVQCTSWSTQVTSGAPNIRYYLSSALAERDDADTHYSEQLWRAGTLLTHQQRVPLPPPTERTYFGLPAQAHLYVCPQTILKFHPEVDELIGGILRSDPHGIIVMKQGRYAHSAQQLLQRFQRTLPDVAGRIVMLPWLSLNDYYRLISIADVVLDTPHFCAGSTTYDIFSFDKPLVTLPGLLNVGRYTLACYRKMELLDLVAASKEEYIQKAVQLGTDRDYRETMNAQIAERSEVLFGDMQVVREHELFFAQAVAKADELRY